MLQPGVCLEPTDTAPTSRGSRPALPADGAGCQGKRGGGRAVPHPSSPGTHLALRGRRHQEQKQERRQQRRRPRRGPRAHGGRPLRAPAWSRDPQALGPPRPLRGARWEPGGEARLASPLGAGFVGLSLPTEASREGRSSSGPALVPPARSPPTLQATSLSPGQRAREARKGCAPAGQVAAGPGQGVQEVMRPRFRSRGAAKWCESG